MLRFNVTELDVTIADRSTGANEPAELDWLAAPSCPPIGPSSHANPTACLAGAGAVAGPAASGDSVLTLLI